jgi:hypothetical protein
MSENIICLKKIIFQSARGLLGIEAESEQTYEPILNVGDENIEESERSEQFLIEESGPGDEGEDISSQVDATAEDLYNVLSL